MREEYLKVCHGNVCLCLVGFWLWAIQTSSLPWWRSSKGARKTSMFLEFGKEIKLCIVIRYICCVEQSLFVNTLGYLSWDLCACVCVCVNPFRIIYEKCFIPNLKKMKRTAHTYIIQIVIAALCLYRLCVVIPASIVIKIGLNVFRMLHSNKGIMTVCLLQIVEVHLLHY